MFAKRAPLERPRQEWPFVKKIETCFRAMILKRLFCVYFGGDMVYKAAAFW